MGSKEQGKIYDRPPPACTLVRGVASWVILKSYALICHWTLLVFNMVELTECEAKAWKDGFTRIVLIYLRYLIGRMIVVESQLLYLN
jgi:hypothetical protein